ncbi:Peptide-N4-(N-acetyl-beta-glucosaminyl)asparagine amidase A [Tolypocladium paradoxum]|uniref:Peptide-N4-(N-acetyl-beta-glucosaminyl)asparagine amidase A n=1 Tax=Tolypocladium paradoxum TaxID=94208 RepID=A0A2S4KTX6_9HYPO|nr:Peptide-N4-(N-acetyl-beta-glucosaminyl)asparagine amidase A [Tolypocladium paradoxum]
MARFWGFALMAPAVLALGRARMRDAMRGVVDVVDNGFVGHGIAPRADEWTAKKPLRCFQVASPVMTPKGLVVDDEIIDFQSSNSSSCQVTLMDHVFANSYGQPFVANYEPPSCAFGRFLASRVIVNLTVVSEGRQYDRLAVMWLGDTEVWRTSTAEPKAHPGIVWTYWKDMSNYISLWRQPQTLIFDLGNLVNEKYTGSFNATLTATFIDEYLPGSQAPPADKIVPFSALRSSQNLGSAFTYPDEKAQSLITLPRNIKRAVASIAANGQADEEFWWSNVPEQGVKTFPNVTLPGLGSFREVRLWIDGGLAGLSWPYPVVFTGGISPPLHRPLVGIQAFDLREQEIDITPWLGLLCDGGQHNFTMEVVGDNDAVVHRYWVLSAKIFLWLNEEGSETTGSTPQVKVTEPDVKKRVSSSPNRCLKYKQTISRRELYIKSSIKRGEGANTTNTSWRQKFMMINDGYVKNGGNFQQVKALYKGEDVAEEEHLMYYYTSYQYPISTTYASKGPDWQYSLTLDANLTQGMELVVNGPTAFPNGIEPFTYKLREKHHGINIKTVRGGHAFFYQLNGGNGSGGFGSMHQSYALGARGFIDIADPKFVTEPLLYSRNVTVVNETITQDRQYVYMSGIGTIDRKSPAQVLVPGDDDQFAPMRTEGRGSSRVISGDRPVDHGKVLANPGALPPPVQVYRRETEEPTDENLGDVLDKLTDELKEELKEEVGKDWEEEICEKLGKR